jgi:alpha-galactosidase
MDMLGFRQLDIAQYSTPGHVNDPDMLEIGNGGMSADEYRTHMSLWSLLSAGLLAGNDIRNMSDETKSILLNREVIAIDQDPDFKTVKAISREGQAVVLARELHGGAVAVGLFNRGDQPVEIGVNWAAAGVTGRNIQVRDLWKHEAVASPGASYSAMVPRHGVVLLRVSAQ